MAESLSMTGEERVLVYLLNFGSLEDVYECDSGLTQKGVSVNVRIQRKHISRHLDKLVGQSLIEEHTKHVKGAKQKMKCYGLTPQGFEKARKILESTSNVTVKVRINGDTRDMRFADIDGATSVHLRLSDIIFEALESVGALDMARLEKIEEENRRLMDEKTMKTDVYRQALAAAWRSGILTSSEEHLVDALRTHLGISDEDHKAMEIVAMNCTPEPYETRVDLHDEILNLLAGQPPEMVEEILELVRGRVAQK